MSLSIELGIQTSAMISAINYPELAGLVKNYVSLPELLVIQLSVQFPVPPIGFVINLEFACIFNARS